MSTPARPPTLFLLSPANMNGVRARQMLSPRSQARAAELLRSPAGVPVAEAFTFMSALYFRGKIAYARHFSRPPESLEEGVYVIAPGFGLVPPQWPVDMLRFARLKRMKVDPKKRSYRRPLETAARELAGSLTSDTRVVLLGSIATGKYVDVLLPVFGERLLFPRSFVGVGDMSRGSIMLKAVAANQELDYAPMEERFVKREASVSA